MPTKWLQERTNGSKNAPVIGFEGPGVGPREVTSANFKRNVSPMKVF